MRRIYLLGEHISHSASPAMHNALYAKMGLDWHYEIKECATEEEAEAFLAARDFIGLNITTPYKPLALQSATIAASTAKLAHGANVLACKKGNLLAFNVDGSGCSDYLERAGFSFAGASVVVCGTGPTSLAALHAAALAGAERITLIGRNKERARRVLGAYVKEFGRLAYATMSVPSATEGHRTFREAFDEVSFLFGSYKTSTQSIAAADLIIDATPCGMEPEDKPPFDTGLLSAGQTVLDAVYGHGETDLIAAARAQGCVALDGLGMLVAQAVATAVTLFEINEVPVSLDADEMFRVMADAAGFQC
ncbi:MAG: shikimate dehydrogenase [Eggerthellaceae bacterium]